MVSVGGVDLVKELVASELRIAVLEKVVEQLVNSQVQSGQRLNIDQEAIRKEALARLNEKYPDLGIRIVQD